MGVGEAIDCPVKSDARPDPVGIIQLLLALDKIADQVSHHYFRDSEGKICMRQVIHGL